VTNQEYFQVLETGQLDPMVEGPEAENMLIVEENEHLRAGEAQIASPFDQHQLHIKQHAVVLMDPSLRATQNNPIVANALQHIMNHAQFIIPDVTGPTDPRLLGVLGIQVMAPNMPPPPQLPTPQAKPNPMPAGGAQIHAGGPGAAQPPRPPTLPGKASPQTANAAANLNHAVQPKMPGGR
jgi:hypothetical protein